MLRQVDPKPAPSLSGGALGLWLASLALSIFVAVLPRSIPHSSEITLDLRVLAFAAALSLLTGSIFGSVPALGAMHGNTGVALRETAPGTTAAAARWRTRMCWWWARSPSR